MLAHTCNHSLWEAAARNCHTLKVLLSPKQPRATVYYSQNMGRGSSRSGHASLLSPLERSRKRAWACKLGAWLGNIDARGDSTEYSRKRGTHMASLQGQGLALGSVEHWGWSSALDPVGLGSQAHSLGQEYSNTWVSGDQTSSNHYKSHWQFKANLAYISRFNVKTKTKPETLTMLL